MVKKFFCGWLAKLLVVLPFVSGNGFSQSAPLPSVPSVNRPPAPNSNIPLSFCDGDRVVFSKMREGTINTVCNSLDDKVGKTEVMISGATWVQNTFPALNGDLYAVSHGKVYKYIQYTFEGPRVQSWRVFGGGGVPFNPDPQRCESNEYGTFCWQERGLSFRFPWDKEVEQLFLYDDGAFYKAPTVKKQEFGYMKSERLGSFEYYLDSKTGTVFRPNKNIFSGAWQGGEEFFSRRGPVNMVVGGADKLYVSLATEGKIVSLAYTGRHAGEVVEETVVYNLGVIEDRNQDRLAISSRGLYFISRSANTDSIWFYNFKTGSISLVFAGSVSEELSGLSITTDSSRVSPPSCYGGGGGCG